MAEVHKGSQLHFKGLDCSFEACRMELGRIIGHGISHHRANVACESTWTHWTDPNRSRNSGECATCASDLSQYIMLTWIRKSWKHGWETCYSSLKTLTLSPLAQIVWYPIWKNVSNKYGTPNSSTIAPRITNLANIACGRPSVNAVYSLRQPPMTACAQVTCMIISYLTGLSMIIHMKAV